MSTEQQELAQTYYRTGKDAFERGQYRQAVGALESALNLVGKGSRLGGDIQIWLVTAYEASGLREEAIALCEQASRHPHSETAKQGRRMLYILKAPRLKRRPDWMTSIPDLANLEEGSTPTRVTYQPSVKPSRRPSKPEEPEPIDLSQVNTEDNSFVWIALVAIALMMGSWLWLG